MMVANNLGLAPCVKNFTAVPVPLINPAKPLMFATIKFLVIKYGLNTGV